MYKFTYFYLLFISLSMVSLSALEPKKSEAASIKEVPIIENGEPLIDLKNQKILAYAVTFPFLVENPGRTKVRKMVYEKLCEAQKLLPKGVRFELIEGLRDGKMQSKLFDEMYRKTQKKYPHMSEKELFEETSKFCAPVKTGSQKVPPHSTGGAVDLFLIDDKGNRLDLGYDPSYNPDITRTDSSYVSSEVRKNRNMMATALRHVGLVNYPAEFWHWSYGDQRWAFVTHSHHAIYGAIEDK